MKTLARKVAPFFLPTRMLARRFLATSAVSRAVGFVLFRGRGRGNPPADIREARRILVLKPDEIGDVVLATGFLRELRRQCPSAHITLAVRSVCAEVVRDGGFADELLIWNDSWRGEVLSSRAFVNLASAAYRRWAGARPDWALIPRSCWDHSNAVLYAWWSGARRICAHEALCIDWGTNRSVLVDQLVTTPEIVHETAFHARMLKALGLAADDVRPLVEPPAAAEEEAEAFFHTVGLRAPVIAFGIGAGCPSRCWPAENFRRLAAEVTGRWPDASVLVIGGPADRDAARIISGDGNDRVVDASGKLSILGTAAALRRCAVFVGNDSAPMHLAAATGCAVVEISKHPQTGDRCGFSPVRFAPVAAWSRILQPEPLESACEQACRKPYAHCITAITVLEVTHAIEAAVNAAFATSALDL